MSSSASPPAASIAIATDNAVIIAILTDDNVLIRGKPTTAPVGTHETLLAYLVRRLLENGANSSFVNRIADPDVAIDDLIVDPVKAVRAMPSSGAPHPAIARRPSSHGCPADGSRVHIRSA